MNKQELRQKDINYYSGSHRDSGYRYKIVNFELFLQITKIVTKSTQEGTEISASALFFYVAGVEISGFLSTFARNFRVWQKFDSI